MAATMLTATPLLPQLERSFSTAAMDSPQRLLIAGCGRLGRAIIKHNAATGQRWQITALRRSATAMDGAKTYTADLADSTELLALGQQPFDCVVYSPAPDQRSADAYRQTYLYGLQNLLASGALKPDGKLIFVSSTAVYGQDDGSYVNEQSITRPASFNGSILLQAEQHALHWPASKPGQRCCVRLAGLYDHLPARYLHMLTQTELDAQKLQRWSNRIHLQDAARLILLLLSQATMPTVINGVDNEPSRLRDLVAWLAQQRDMVWPLADTAAGSISGDECGKRISNALAHSLGFVPAYPSYREGCSKQPIPASTE